MYLPAIAVVVWVMLSLCHNDYFANVPWWQLEALLVVAAW
jgi:hypothetical protein